MERKVGRPKLVVLLRAEDQVGIIGAGCRSCGPAGAQRDRVVRIRDVTVRAVCLGVKHAVDEDRHPSVAQAPLDGDVMPHAVSDLSGPAQRALGAV